ncbi:MAG: ArsR/SmtB family transcription factor [Anaerolineaceae bacterium]|jgi:ArsR family transcriptional regulator
MEPFIELSTLFKILSDPNRLKIFQLLINGDYCNCELNQITELPINLLSHHLRILHDAGLINSERDSRDARWIHYSINQENVKKVSKEIESFLQPEILNRRTPVCKPNSRKSEQDNDH